MDRVQYARYIFARISASLVIAIGFALLACGLQDALELSPLHWVPHGVGRHPGLAGRLAAVEWWAWPAAFAAAAHVVFGPKQIHPVYRRIPGAMFSYAGVSVDRGAGCRGGLATGATGSGKTLACILPRLHSICVHEGGIEHRGWRGSRARRDLESARRGRSALHREEGQRLKALAAALAEARARQNLSALDPEAPAPEGGCAGENACREIQLEIDRTMCLREARDRELREAADRCRRVRFQVPPWGGCIFGEKGNEWQAMEALLRRHGRQEDLCLLQTRPPWARRDWSPSTRLNLIAADDVPADTFAKMIVDTGLSVEESGTRDEFFVPQARDKIAWGIRLLRSVKAAAQGPSAGQASLVTLLDILTVPESYRRFLQDCTRACPQLASSASFLEARFQLENNYWNQPADQLGGVRSTLYNFLAPFAEPEIAEVFCADSTFDLSDIQLGKVVCLAIPQKFAVQRRYVASLIKMLAYQIVLERFDRCGGNHEWLNRNVVLVEQDEWQRQAMRSDCDADVVREAQGAIYAATQSQNAVWLRLGGREHAVPLTANLRNRWICQAATEECAEESSNLISGRISREVSYSTGAAGRTTNVSFPERAFIARRELRMLPPFHVIFVPAEGRWLYRKCIAMPVTPEGGIPPWWFGDWNPLHWVAHGLGLPERFAGVALHPGARFIPPWRACAPWRAHLRWLGGLDGTFIILGGMTTAAARRGPS